jgi:hypothetical protein
MQTRGIRLDNPERLWGLVHIAVQLRVGDALAGHHSDALLEHSLNHDPVVSLSRQIQLLSEYVPDGKQGGLLESPAPEFWMVRLTSSLGNQAAEADPTPLPSTWDLGPKLAQADEMGFP